MRGSPARSSSAPARRGPPASLEELRLRARGLGGRTVGALAQRLGDALPTDPVHAKGFVGGLIERGLGADPDAYDRPDFLALGVELKTVPVDAAGQPTASTFCCAIDMDGSTSVAWENARLARKLGHVLWVPVLEDPNVSHRQIMTPLWWKPDDREWKALRGDWEDLMGQIGAGQAAALTAYEGVALQVRPKGRNAQSRTVVPTEDGAGWGQPLGFYLRRRFVAAVLGRLRGTQQESISGH